MRSFVEKAAKAYYQGGPVIDIGGDTAAIRKQRGISHWPGLFDPGAYRVLDLQTVKGVDVTANAERLPIRDCSIGFVIWIWTLEHMRRFWLVAQEIERVLRAGGILTVSAPWVFREHRAPIDYWRVSPDALRFLMTDVGLTILESEVVSIGDHKEGVGSYVVGRKPDALS